MVEFNVKVLNLALKLRREGRTIKQIEEVTKCKILHKIFPLLKRHYNKLPSKVTPAEALIIRNKLREEELNYRRRKLMFERGQRRISEYG